jgi:hypothetical protein
VVANFFTGHDIDKLKYDKSPWDDPRYYREEYLKLARPYLNPISGLVIEAQTNAAREYSEREKALQAKYDEVIKTVEALKRALEVAGVLLPASPQVP